MHMQKQVCERRGSFIIRGARWLSCRASNSGARGRGFQTYFRRVEPLSRTLYSPKVLVIPRKRWFRPDMTEKLLTGMLSLNTNKHVLLFQVTCLNANYTDSGLFGFVAAALPENMDKVGLLTIEKKPINFKHKKNLM